MCANIRLPFHLLLPLLASLTVFSGRISQPEAVIPSATLEVEAETVLVLQSYGFQAQKRSYFTIGSQKETVKRGMTLIHFHSRETYEFRTFDTYGDGKALDELIGHIKRFQEDKAYFALLVHDSATKNSMESVAALNALGLTKLRSLQGRQAYVMHNLNGTIFEKIGDTEAEVSLAIPKKIQDPEIHFPKVTYSFEPRYDRYIAHAGGEVNGHAYTNTRNALDESYQKGFRLFELDIIQTSDGQYVAAHDWNMWSRFTEYGGELPPTHAEFKKHTIYGDYITMDMQAINDWFSKHGDAILVTDKIADPVDFASGFVDRSRLIMELFSPMAVEEASKNGIQAMMSQRPLLALKGDKIHFLKVNNVKYVAVSRRIIERQKELMLQLRDAGIRVYVYNVNFDPGKDERYVYDNELGLVYGMYADKWVFGNQNPNPSK